MELLSKIQWWLQFCGAITGVVAAFAGVGVLVVTGRLAGLREVAMQEGERRLAAAEASVDAVQQYGNMANLNALGLMGIAGQGIAEHSPIEAMISPLWIRKGDQAYPRCDAGDEGRWRLVTETYPTFPFGFYGLAVCQRVNKVNDWRKTAMRAVEILDKTTKIAGHHPDQALLLAKIKKDLDPSTPDLPKNQ